MTLGDRIAVMSAGQLQQTGNPQEVYDRPANTFVARFIGSPPMNLLAGTVSAGRLRAGDLEIEGMCAPDGAVVVGIRPEAIRPVGSEHPGPGLEVRVEVVEPLGDAVLVHGSVQARTAAITDELEETPRLSDERGDQAMLMLKIDARERPVVGSVLHTAIDPREVHLFDAVTGDRIES